jgi:hypothetical protein
MKTMTVPTREGTEQVSGLELKRFFVHRTLKTASGADPETWTITHKATGRALSRNHKTRAEALTIARRLDGYAGFDDIPVDVPRDGFPKEQFQELRQFVTSVYAAVVLGIALSITVPPVADIPLQTIAPQPAPVCLSTYDCNLLKGGK